MWGKTESAIPGKGDDPKKEYLHVRMKNKEAFVFELDEVEPNFAIWKHQFVSIQTGGGDVVFLNVDEIEAMYNVFRPVL